MKKIKRIFGGNKDKAKNDLAASSIRGSMSSLYSNQSDQNPTNLNRLDSSKIRLPKLHQAAKSGNVMKIDKELRKCPADTTDAIGRTAIHIACLHNKMEAVKMLCKQPRANINAVDTEGRTALMYSAEYGNYDCCEVLIGNKPSPDLNLTDNYGCNALHYAMCNDKGNTFIVRLLCQSGVSLHARSVAGQTPFHLAAQQNQSSLIPILLEHHAELDTTDAKGRTALMTAASEGHFEIVDLLIKAGANSNVKDVEGNTAENIAHIGGHQGIYEYLKDINETNPKSDTLQKLEESESESESEFTKVSMANSVPIPRAAPPYRLENQAAHIDDDDDDDKDEMTVSWKSSESSSEDESENEKPAVKEPESLKKVDFRAIMGSFNENFQDMQELSGSQDVKDVSEWDSENKNTGGQLTEGLEETISKWDTDDPSESIISDSFQIKQSKKKKAAPPPKTTQIEKEESIEKLKNFYQKTGASEEAITEGLGLQPDAVNSKPEGVDSKPEVEEESIWDDTTTADPVVLPVGTTIQPDFVESSHDLSKWDDSEDSSQSEDDNGQIPITSNPIGSVNLLETKIEEKSEVSDWDSIDPSDQKPAPNPNPIQLTQKSEASNWDSDGSLPVSIPKNKPEFDPSDSSTSEDTDQDVESDLEKEDDMSGSIRDRISQLHSGHPPTQIHSQPTQHNSAAPVPVPVHGRVSNHSLNSSGHEPENRLSNQSSRSAMSPVQSNFNPVRSQSKTSLHSNDSEPPRSMASHGSYSGLPLGVTAHAMKPTIKPASNIAAYDNRRGMGRSLVGDDEYSSSIDLEHQRIVDGKDERIRFLETNLRRLQDQVENQPENHSADFEAKLKESEALIGQYKMRNEEVEKALQISRSQCSKLQNEKDQMISRTTSQHSEEVEDLHDKIEELSASEAKLKLYTRDLEMKIEEQSKVKAMIDGINASNQKNIETFEDQINQRNVTIENLKGENDDLKRRLDRIDKDYKKAVEQRDQFHIEAQQAADSSMLEQQLDDYRDRVDSLEQSTRDKDDQIHQLNLRLHSDLSEKQREYVELEQSFKFTNQTLNETKHRMELAEDELRQMQRDYPALRTEVESLRRQNGSLSDQLKNNEMNAGSINFKMEQLSTENEKLRNEVLAANMKIQEHLGSVRVAETNNEHFRKSYEKEKERSEKLRSDLDETKLERNELIRDKEDAQMRAQAAEEKFERAESEKRNFELETKKAIQTADFQRSQNENEIRNWERDLATTKLDAENYKVRYEESSSEIGRLKEELQRAHAQEVLHNKTIAQLEAQVSSESEQRGNLSLREQSWLDERNDFRDEISSVRNEYNNYKIQADDNERRNRDRLEDMKIKKMNLENIVKAKEDEIERYKEMSDRHQRAVIATEEKGHATYEENNLLKRELERLKIESNTINSSTNDQLIKLRNEIEELKIKLKLETDARKAAQKLAKELQLKNDKLRLRGAKKGKFDGKELEEIQKRYHQEARKELEEKLAQVSQFLAQQNSQNERLEQIRSENLQHEKHASFKRIADLESELSAFKSGSLNGSFNEEARYQKLYREEVRARERSDGQFRRMEKKFMELQQRFDQERAQRLSHASMYSVAPSYPQKHYPSLGTSLHQPNSAFNQSLTSNNARRYSPTPTQPGIFSQMQNVMDRATMEPVSRSSPLQRI